VLASLNVNVIVAVSPAFTLDFELVTAMVGLIVSAVVLDPYCVAPTEMMLPTASALNSLTDVMKSLALLVFFRMIEEPYHYYLPITEHRFQRSQQTTTLASGCLGTQSYRRFQNSISGSNSFW